MPSEAFTVTGVTLHPLGGVTVCGRLAFEDEVIDSFEQSRWLRVLEVLAQPLDIASGTIEVVGLVVRLIDEELLEIWGASALLRGIPAGRAAWVGFSRRWSPTTSVCADLRRCANADRGVAPFFAGWMLDRNGNTS